MTGGAATARIGNERRYLRTIDDLEDLDYAQVLADIARVNPSPELLQRTQVVLFGAAQMGRRFRASLRHTDLEAVAFSDNARDLWGTSLDGLPVVAPGELAPRYGRDARILIASDHFVAIAGQLREMGFRNIYSCMYLAAMGDGRCYQPPYYRNAVRSITDNKDAIRRLHARLADDRSRAVLLAILDARLSLDNRIAAVDGDEYFDPTIVPIGPGQVFVDVGAFDGDTVAGYRAACGDRFARIYAFEPDARNFSKLQAKFGRDPRIELFEKGVFSATTRLSFVSQGIDSSLSPDGDQAIEVVDLDHFLAGRPVDFIKMDIEGAEPAALAGAQALIRGQRPNLAICVYHVPEQLWELPLLLEDYNPAYALYLRHYTHNLLDTICYAV